MFLIVYNMQKEKRLLAQPIMIEISIVKLDSFMGDGMHIQIVSFVKNKCRAYNVFSNSKILLLTI